MIDDSFYSMLTDSSLQGKACDDSVYLKMLTSKNIEILPLLNAAFKVRKRFFGKEVKIHIINNVQNGSCSENCSYCAQSKSSKAEIQKYPMKSDKEILLEAKNAYETGAFRYCMVFSGKGPTRQRVEHLSEIIKSIKDKYPMEVCVSPGTLDKESLTILKKAGLDRFNHNLNTSERFYKNICTSHNFEKRLQTLSDANKVGLDICSGIIAGMGESPKDLIDMAKTFRSLKKVKSIPVNFLIPISGNLLNKTSSLTPQYCLKVLCLFRFLNPKAEIRAAAGREIHLRSLQPLCLYPANSIFMSGYLNASGAVLQKDFQMILDAGFTIKSSYSVEQIQKKLNKDQNITPQLNFSLKSEKELRPLL